MTPTKKLVAFISLLVALAVVSTAAPVALAASARRPVAMVPGLQYDPATMIPREI